MSLELETVRVDDDGPVTSSKASINAQAMPLGRAVNHLAPDAAGRVRRDRGWSNQRTLLLYLVGGLLIAAIPVVVSRVVDRPVGTTHTIDIPLGTADRLAAGEGAEIIPDELDFKLRDVLVIVNHDSVAHTIGPFVVGPGERSEHSFGETAAYSSYCSLHPSGTISISIGLGIGDG